MSDERACLVFSWQGLYIYVDYDWQLANEHVNWVLVMGPGCALVLHAIVKPAHLVKTRVVATNALL